MNDVIQRSVKAELVDSLGLVEWQIGTVIEQPEGTTQRIFVITAPDGKQCGVTVAALKLLLSQAKAIEEELTAKEATTEESP